MIYDTHSAIHKGYSTSLKIAWLIYKNWGEGRSCYDLVGEAFFVVVYFYGYHFYLLLHGLRHFIDNII